LAFARVYIIIYVRTKVRWEKCPREQEDQRKTLKKYVLKLQNCADELNITRTDVINKGIELVKKEIENKK